jgi:hypothetical protein
MKNIWTFVNRYATTLLWMVLLFALDWSASLISCSIKGEQQQTAQCAILAVGKDGPAGR